jgi:hypothetical protein
VYPNATINKRSAFQGFETGSSEIDQTLWISEMISVIVEVPRQSKTI